MPLKLDHLAEELRLLLLKRSEAVAALVACEIPEVIATGLPGNTRT
jgi:hypothetical protein